MLLILGILLTLGLGYFVFTAPILPDDNDWMDP